MSRRLELTVLITYGLGLALLVGAVVWLNGGHFSYSLDDAYIHLALAENLLAGHYGLNVGEASSPASSVAWPVLLAPFSRLPAFELVPLLIGVASLVGVWLTLLRFFRERLRGIEPAAQLVILLLMALGLNFWGMPLNGMEHSLQLLLTVWVAVGLIDLVEDDRVRPTLLAGLALGPLIRYENTSLLLMGTLILWARGRRGRALATAAVAATGLAAHALFLRASGLPWLPSSVLTKVEATSATTLGSRLFEVGENLLESLAKDRVLAILALLAALWARRRASSPVRVERDRLYVFFLAGTLAAHMLGGRYDWLGRYEIYLMLAAAVVLLFAFRERLAALLSGGRRWAVAGLVLAALVVGKNQVLATAITPVSAANIYAIHFQMHRFARDHWRDRIGVTDVGRVTLDNPYYVLDLWGLGSEEARRLRHGASDNGWLDRLARAHRVDVVIADAAWFDGPLPPSWERIGRLGAFGVGHGRGPQTIFLVDPGRREELAGALAALAAELPATSSLVLEEPARFGLAGEEAGVDSRNQP